MRDQRWIERVIGDAVESGRLEPTTGVGRPIDGLDRPHDDLWWVRSWIERERIRDALGPRSGEEPAGPEEAAGGTFADR